MNVLKTCMLAVSSLVLINTVQLLQAQPLLNSTFETDTIGEAPSSPWTVTSVVAPSSITVESIAQSPFTTGNRGMLWNDGETSSFGPVAYAQFVETTGKLTWSFDFMLPTASALANVSVSMGSTAGTINSAGPSLFLGRVEGKLQVNDGAAMLSVADITSDAWYHVELSVDVVNNTYDVSLQPYGGTLSVVASDLEFRSTQTSLSYVNIGDNSGGKISGSVYFDNVEVTAIPEVSSTAYVLLALIGLLLFARKSRN